MAFPFDQEADILNRAPASSNGIAGGGPGAPKKVATP
jgi:hypothetical protein